MAVIVQAVMNPLPRYEVRKKDSTTGSPEYNLYRLHNTFNLTPMLGLKIGCFSGLLLNEKCD